MTEDEAYDYLMELIDPGKHHDRESEAFYARLEADPYPSYPAGYPELGG